MIQTWPLKGGAEFHAHRRLTPDRIPALDFMEEHELRQFVLERWRRAFNAKRPELARMYLQEKYWSGRHYNDARENRLNPVVNLTFALIETLWANLTEQLPVPQMVPTVAGLNKMQINDQAEFGKWLMRGTQFTTPYLLTRRANLKHGTCFTQMTIDPATGIGWPKFFSGYDFYKDPFARHEDELEYYFMAGPVPTRLLWALYPDPVLRRQIKPDGLMSPSYNVLVKPYLDDPAMEATSVDAVFPAFSFTRDTDPAATTGTQLVISNEADSNADAETTFVMHMFVRDRSKMVVKYVGEHVRPDPIEPGFYVRTPMVQPRAEAACPSGWRVISMTATGAFLEPGAPLDPCFLGQNIVVGRNYSHEGRFYGVGDADNVIPINRDYDHHRALLKGALELAARPVLLMDDDAGTDLDERSVGPGDVVKKRRGTEVKWLDFGGLAGQQYEILNIIRAEFDSVSGVYDATYGRRPEGVEAGVAIRDLRNAALTRVRAKENEQLLELSKILKKQMYITAKKASRPIVFQATSGRSITIDPQRLVLDMDFEWARGSGTAISREVWEEKLKELYQLGIVDEQAVLEMTDFPYRAELLQRIEQRRIVEMAMEAEANANAAPASNGPPANGGQG